MGREVACGLRRADALRRSLHQPDARACTTRRPSADGRDQARRRQSCRYTGGRGGLGSLRYDHDQVTGATGTEVITVFACGAAAGLGASGARCEVSSSSGVMWQQSAEHVLRCCGSACLLQQDLTGSWARFRSCSPPQQHCRDTRPVCRQLYTGTATANCVPRKTRRNKLVAKRFICHPCCSSP